MATPESRQKLTTSEKKLIEQIKKIRRAKGISQEELSSLLGKNSNYMGMVESYRRGISLRTLFKIARVLRVKLEEFFKW